MPYMFGGIKVSELEQIIFEKEIELRNT